MKKKVVGIFVCMLLIATTIPMVIGTEEKLQIMSPGVVDQQKPNTPVLEPRQVVDQSQVQCDDCMYIMNYAWQEFVPRGNKLLTVDLSISQWFMGSPNLEITIEKPLGTVLSSASVPVASVPENVCDWVSINVEPDITLEKGQTYFIVYSYPPGGEYGWCGAEGNLYAPGASSIGANWDFCFSTIVDKSKPRDFVNILENYPILYQLLQKLIDNIPNLGQKLNY